MIPYLRQDRGGVCGGSSVGPNAAGGAAGGGGSSFGPPAAVPPPPHSMVPGMAAAASTADRSVGAVSENNAVHNAHRMDKRGGEEASRKMQVNKKASNHLTQEKVQLSRTFNMNEIELFASHWKGKGKED